jgi:hypothetical protein
MRNIGILALSPFIFNSEFREHETVTEMNIHEVTHELGHAFDRRLGWKSRNETQLAAVIGRTGFPDSPDPDHCQYYLVP